MEGGGIVEGVRGDFFMLARMLVVVVVVVVEVVLVELS